MVADCSLYYPYIHIRDVEWLKATLLLFRQVRRMTPLPGVQPDDGPIEPFTQAIGRDPLVLSVNLWSERATAAQVELARRLREDGNNPDFVNKFGRQATVAQQPAGDLGFQIHQAKLHQSLRNAFRDTALAWRPDAPEPYDESDEYVAVNPNVGQAVMATLAIACALGEGLDIVGDQRSGPLHECLTKRQPKDVYDAWLNPTTDIPDPRQPDGRELSEFLVFVACDTSDLDAEALAKMGDDREPIRALLAALSVGAKDMVPMDPGPQRTQQFKDEIATVLRKWDADRLNMSRFWRKFFGVGALDTGGKSLEKYISKTLETAPAATSGTFAGLALQGQGPLLSIGAGLGIGLFTHALKTYGDLRNKDRESPYRYLTSMEKAGVVIRTDLRYPPEKDQELSTTPRN